jgi:glycosyltransferase involved in cell wall biosynthesis
MRRLRVLTIGHSYVVALNRAVMARVAADPLIELTLAAPRSFHGDLRALDLEPDTHQRAYRLISLPTTFSRQIHTFFYGGLRHLIQPGAFDLVHFWEEPYVLAGWQVARAATRAGAPFVFRSAQSLPKPYMRPFLDFERYCVRRAAGWVGGGQFVYQALAERGYPTSNACVIPLGVDEDRFFPGPEAGRGMRAKLGFDPAVPLIGFIGRLTAAKGLDVLMAALEQTQGPWNFLALGSGLYEPVLRQWAAARGLQGRVRVMLARHEEMPDYVRAMDLLVAPSQTTPNWKEQFGRMLVEGFACGVPVIGSDSGEIPIVLDGVGEVVAEKDAAAWSRAIDALLAAPERRRVMGEAGRARFLDQFSCRVLASRWVEFFLGTIDSREPTIAARAGGDLA